jgi:hypothetical protein
MSPTSNMEQNKNFPTSQAGALCAARHPVIIGGGRLCRAQFDTVGIDDRNFAGASQARRRDQVLRR